MKSKHRRMASLLLAFSLTAGITTVPFGSIMANEGNVAAEAAVESNKLQQAFEKAAKEFQVPQSVLMAVAYHQSRWDHHKGHSEVGGYGVMNLIQIPDDQSAKGKHDEQEVDSSEIENSPVNTLDQAAKLLGLDSQVLKSDTEQNIRGGAALLKEYAGQTIGQASSNPSDWYGAVVKFSGSDYEEVAEGFANQVFATIQNGAERTTLNGQKVKLKAEPVEPNKKTADNIPLRNVKFTDTDCPNGLECSFIPAAYKPFSSSPTNYGNYDIANRPEDGLEIRYIVIHDIEGSVQSAINIFQAKSYVSAHYILDSAEGKITQMVKPKDVPWHAGNWYFNMHSIGIEHEGYAADGASWYSEQMYRSTAKLVKYLSERYNIPIDRQHIIGHDEIPGLTTAKHAGMHWDPGAYWDWSHFFNLLGASVNPSQGDKNSHIVTIRPNFNTNEPTFTYGGDVKDPQSSSMVHLYTKPSFDAPLISDPVIHKNGAAGTTNLYDWGNKAAIGQSYYQVDQEGDWTAINYGGQKAWFYNPNEKNTVPGSGILIAPKEGMDSVPVYGAAYPEQSAYDGTGIEAWARGKADVLYQLPAGQIYVATGPIQSDYYHAKYFNDPATNQVVKGDDEYYQIFFNHRLGFVKKSDVDIIND